MNARNRNRMMGRVGLVLLMSLVLEGCQVEDKAQVLVMVDESLVTAQGLDAGKIIKEQVAQLIKGGGGGQPFYASAGGTNAEGLSAAIDAVKAKL